jgi:hypothetical protein
MVGPTVTPYLTDNPWVEVVFPSVAVGTVTITVYRLSEDRTWTVRGAQRIDPGVAALDYEVPFQRSVTYRGEQFDTFGNSLGFTDPTTLTVNYDGTVIHQPLSPNLWASVILELKSAETLLRPTPGELVDIEGGTVGRWIGSRRRGLRGVPVQFGTDTLDAADQVQAMLGSYVTEQVGVLCIRTSDTSVRWPGTFFARGDLVERELDLKYGGTYIEFEGTMDEVEPPIPGLVVPLLTYDDLDAFGDYTAQDAGWITYTLRDRAYSLAGLV